MTHHYFIFKYFFKNHVRKFIIKKEIKLKKILIFIIFCKNIPTCSSCSSHIKPSNQELKLRSQELKQKKNKKKKLK